MIKINQLTKRDIDRKVKYTLSDNPEIAAISHYPQFEYGKLKTWMDNYIEVLYDDGSLSATDPGSLEFIDG